MPGEFRRRTIIISFQDWNKILVATDIKIIARWKQLWQDGWQQRTRTDISREQDGSSHDKTNGWTVAATVPESSRAAVKLRVNYFDIFYLVQDIKFIIINPLTPNDL
jgi:hypothetical protein